MYRQAGEADVDMNSTVDSRCNRKELTHADASRAQEFMHRRLKSCSRMLTFKYSSRLMCLYVCVFRLLPTWLFFRTAPLGGERRGESVWPAVLGSSVQAHTRAVTKGPSFQTKSVDQKSS